MTYLEYTKTNCRYFRYDNENDVSELFEKKFEIFAKLSSSGLLAHLPLDKIMTLVPSNMEDSVQSELNNLSLE